MDSMKHWFLIIKAKNTILTHLVIYFFSTMSVLWSAFLLYPWDYDNAYVVTLFSVMRENFLHSLVRGLTLFRATMIT